MIPIAKPLLGEEEKRAVLEVLDSGMLAGGKKVREFESAFAEYIGAKHAIATSNGTTALHAALLAHGIGEGDEVITSPFSFVATANTIRMCGAIPVFVDVDENTFNINLSLLEAAITPRTKAILPVHLFGLPAEMDKIQTIAKKYNLIIIEDACQAHGAEYKGKKVGSFGTGCFSFFATKNMITGEGGMITTNNDAVAEKVRMIINHGSMQKYYHRMLGFNYRMTDIAAAMGSVQLRKLSPFNYQRKRNAALLNDGLHDLPGILLPALQEGHVFHQYTIRVLPPHSRDRIAAALREKGIECTIYYPLCIHQQESYHDFASKSFPVAERVAKEVLSLPVHPALSEEELKYVIQMVKEVMQENKR